MPPRNNSHAGRVSTKKRSTTTTGGTGAAKGGLGVSFRPSTLLEQSLADNLPLHCSAKNPTATTTGGGGGGEPRAVARDLRFQKMSGRGRTRREELEAAQLDDRGDERDDEEMLDEGEAEEEEEEEEEDEEEEDEAEDASEGQQGQDLVVAARGSKTPRGQGQKRNPAAAAAMRSGVSKATAGAGVTREKNLNKRNSGSVGRRKITMSFIEEKARRTVTFTKRKSGLMKKAFELSTLTGTDCLVLVVSESGLVYTFATPSLKAVTESPTGQRVISLALKGKLSGDEDGDDVDMDEEEREPRDDFAEGEQDREGGSTRRRGGGGGGGRRKSATKTNGSLGDTTTNARVHSGVSSTSSRSREHSQGVAAHHHHQLGQRDASASSGGVRDLFVDLLDPALVGVSTSHHPDPLHPFAHHLHHGSPYDLPVVTSVASSSSTGGHPPSSVVYPFVSSSELNHNHHNHHNHHHHDHHLAANSAGATGAGPNPFSIPPPPSSPFLEFDPRLAFDPDVVGVDFDQLPIPPPLRGAATRSASSSSSTMATTTTVPLPPSLPLPLPLPVSRPLDDAAFGLADPSSSSTVTRVATGSSSALTERRQSRRRQQRQHGGTCDQEDDDATTALTDSAAALRHPHVGDGRRGDDPYQLGDALERDVSVSAVVAREDRDDDDDDEEEEEEEEEEVEGERGGGGREEEATQGNEGTGDGDQEDVVEFARAAENHREAFERYQARTDWNKIFAPPPPPPMPLTRTTTDQDLSGGACGRGGAEEEVEEEDDEDDDDETRRAITTATGTARKRALSRLDRELDDRQGPGAREGDDGGENDKDDDTARVEQDQDGEAPGESGSHRSNKRRRVRLGAKDFGPEAIEWQNRITRRAATTTAPPPGPTMTTEAREETMEALVRNDDSNRSPRLRSRSRSLSAAAQDRARAGQGPLSRTEATTALDERDAATTSTGPTGDQSLEARRRFWTEKAKESISNAKRSPTILGFLHAHFLSYVSTSTIPPSIPRVPRGGEGRGHAVIENLPKPGPQAMTFERFKRFLSSRGGSDRLGLKAMVDSFIETEGGGGGYNNKVGTAKQHLIEWFDFLEGHGLIDEQEYFELISF